MAPQTFSRLLAVVMVATLSLIAPPARAAETASTNAPPVFISQPEALARVTAPYRYAPLATDPDGDPVTITLTQGPTGYRWDAAAAAYVFQPLSSQRGTHTVSFSASDGRGGTATQTQTLRVVEDHCALYPIAIAQALVANAASGQQFNNVARGQGSGNFSWLTWNGSPNVPTLAESLLPPGDSWRYVNPDRADDPVLSLGDWIQGSPGNMNAADVRARVQALFNTPIIVPTFDQTRGQGNNFDYRSARFIRIELTALQATGQGTLSFRYLGPETCYASNGQLDAERVAIWGHATSGEAITWDGSENLIRRGLVHANATLRMNGSRNDFGGSVRHVTGFTGSGNENRFVRLPVQVPLQPLPITVDIQAYRPGSALAASFGAQFHNRSAQCTAGNGKWTINAPGTTLAEGVHWVPCDIDVSGSNLTARVTIISTGRIWFGGNTFRLTPFHAGISLATSAAGNDAVRLSGGDSDVRGLIWAAAGGMEIATNRWKHGCPIIGNRIRLSASHFDVDVTDCLAFAQPVNHPPVITTTAPTSATTGVAYTYDVDATDPDNDALTYALTASPAGMAINAGTGVISWTPTTAQVGPNNITVRVTDGRGGEATQTATITVVQANRPPVITTTAPAAATSGVAYTYDVDATDPDNDTLTYALTASPAGMTISASTGVISWTPTTAQVGPNSITVRVTDGRGGEATQTATIAVVQANRPPVITTTAPTSATTGVAYTYDVDATDPDSDTLTYALTTSPAGMTINASTGVISWTPTAAQVGPNSITVRVTDGRGGEATQTGTITVVQVNRPPRITSTPVTRVNEGVEYRYDVDAIDPDNDVLRYLLRQSPPAMQIDEATGMLAWPANPMLVQPVLANDPRCQTIVESAGLSTGLTPEQVARVKSAVSRGAAYVTPEVIRWNRTMGCLGCHVQTQVLVGLEASREKVEIDAPAAEYLLRALRDNQHADGNVSLCSFTDFWTPAPPRDERLSARYAPSEGAVRCRSASIAGSRRSRRSRY